MKKNKLILSTLVTLMLIPAIISGLPANADSTSEANALSLYQQACTLEYQNNYKEAAAKLAEAIALSPKDSKLYIKLAGIYTEMSEFDKALEVYSRVIQLKPNDAFIYISVGSIYESKGDYQNALKAYEEALRMFPDYKYNYLNIANVQYLISDYKSAIQNYNKFLSTYNQHWEARESLANSYLKDGNASAAVKEYENLYSRNPLGFKDFSNYGIALFKMDKFDKAAEMLEKAIEINPENTSAHVTLALAYQELEKYEMALAQYDVVFRQQPDLNSLRFDYGNLLADMGSNKAALAQYKLYMATYPNDGRVYKNMGIVYRRLNDIDSTISNYEKAINLPGSDSDINMKEELAECYHIKKNYENALKYYDEVLAVKKDDYKVKTNKAILLHAMQKYDEAIVMYTELLSTKDTPDIQVNLTSALVAQGKICLTEHNYTKATEYLERAVQRGTKDSYAFFGLAQSYRVSGDNEKATEYFEKAISMDPEKKLYSDEYADFITTTAKKEIEISYKNTPKAVDGELPAVSITVDPVNETGYDVDKNKTLIQIGDENYKKENYDIAITNYQDALKINPSDEVTLLKLGNIYKAKNDNKNATNFYKKSIFVNPAYTDGWFNLGLVYASENNVSGAKDCFHRVIALDSEYAYAYFALAIAFENDGDKQEALRNYKIFLSHNPDEQTAKTVQEKIKLLSE